VLDIADISLLQESWLDATNTMTCILKCPVRTTAMTQTIQLDILIVLLVSYSELPQ